MSNVRHFVFLIFVSAVLCDQPVPSAALVSSEQSRCQNSESLLRILNNILEILSQDMKIEKPQVDKINTVLDLVKGYLGEGPRNLDNTELYYNLKSLEHDLEKDKMAHGNDKLSLRKLIDDQGKIKTKVVFKYELPSINQPNCKEAFMKLINIAQNAYLELAKHPACEIASNPDPTNRNYNHDNVNSNAYQPPSSFNTKYGTVPMFNVANQNPSNDFVEYMNNQKYYQNPNIINLLQNYRPGNVANAPVNLQSLNNNNPGPYTPGAAQNYYYSVPNSFNPNGQVNPTFLTNKSPQTPENMVDQFDVNVPDNIFYPDNVIVSNTEPTIRSETSVEPKSVITPKELQKYPVQSTSDNNYVPQNSPTNIGHPPTSALTPSLVNDNNNGQNIQTYQNQQRLVPTGQNQYPHEQHLPEHFNNDFDPVQTLAQQFLSPVPQNSILQKQPQPISSDQSHIQNSYSHNLFPIHQNDNPNVKLTGPIPNNLNGLPTAQPSATPKSNGSNPLLNPQQFENVNPNLQNVQSQPQLGTISNIPNEFANLQPGYNVRNSPNGSPNLQTLPFMNNQKVLPSQQPMFQKQNFWPNQAQSGINNVYDIFPNLQQGYANNNLLSNQEDTPNLYYDQKMLPTQQNGVVSNVQNSLPKQQQYDYPKSNKILPSNQQLPTEAQNKLPSQQNGVYNIVKNDIPYKQQVNSPNINQNLLPIGQQYANPYYGQNRPNQENGGANNVQNSLPNQNQHGFPNNNQGLLQNQQHSVYLYYNNRIPYQQQNLYNREKNWLPNQQSKKSNFLLSPQQVWELNNLPPGLQNQERPETPKHYQNLLNNHQNSFLSQPNFLYQQKNLINNDQNGRPNQQILNQIMPNQKFGNINPLAKYISGQNVNFPVNDKTASLFGVTNSFQLNHLPNKPGLIELTYVLNPPDPFLYQPYYYVKYKLPYINFISNLKELLRRKPNLRNSPTKLYQELLSNTNITEISPYLKNYSKDDILKLVSNNGAFVKAKLVNSNDTFVTDQIKIVHDLNSNMKFNDILKSLDNMIDFNNKTNILDYGAPQNVSDDVVPVITFNSFELETGNDKEKLVRPNSRNYTNGAQSTQELGSVPQRTPVNNYKYNNLAQNYKKPFIDETRGNSYPMYLQPPITNGSPYVQNRYYSQPNALTSLNVGGLSGPSPAIYLNPTLPTYGNPQSHTQNNVNSGYQYEHVSPAMADVYNLLNGYPPFPNRTPQG